MKVKQGNVYEKLGAFVAVFNDPRSVPMKRTL